MGLAKAFDGNDCGPIYAHLSRVSAFSIDGGKADFGDDLDIGGAPRGTAVVCWSRDGRASVKGKLYADQLCGPLRPCDALTVAAEISFQSQDARGHWIHVTSLD